MTESQPLQLQQPSISAGDADDAAAAAAADGRVWVMKHFSGSVVLQYDNFEDFVTDRVSVVHELPQSFYGTGHVVHAGSIYFHRAGTDQIVR